MAYRNWNFKTKKLHRIYNARKHFGFYLRPESRWQSWRRFAANSTMGRALSSHAGRRKSRKDQRCGASEAAPQKGNSEMNYEQSYPDQQAVSSRTAVHRNGKRNSTSPAMVPKPLVEEMTELVLDLHAMLEGYAPHWYTQGMDYRVREMLIRAEWALRKSS
jgi:hypothetical protein